MNMLNYDPTKTDFALQAKAIAGYVFERTCNCDGHYTEVFKRKGSDYELRWRRGQLKFRLRRGSLIIKNWTDYKDLKHVLTEAHKEVV